MERVSSEDKSLSPQGLRLTPSMPSDCLVPGAGGVRPSTSAVPRAGRAHLHAAEVRRPDVTQSLLRATVWLRIQSEAHRQTRRGLMLKWDPSLLRG